MNFVFFSPYTLMWNTTLVEKAFKINLENKKNKIFVINCHQDLKDHCMCFNAAGLSNEANKIEKLNICKRCIDYKNILRKNLDQEFYDIKDLLKKEDIILIEDLIKKTNIDNYQTLSIFNIELGKIALHDLILIKKLNSLKKLEEHWDFYKNILKTTLKCLYAFKNLTKIHDIDFVISPNNLYSHHQVVAKYANSVNIGHYNVTSNSLLTDRKLQFVKVMKGITPGFSLYALEKWKNSDFLLSKASIDFVIEYLKSNFSGRHYLNFSKPKTKKQSLLPEKVKNYKKIIGIILSSAEEDFCLIQSNVNLQHTSKHKVFQSQAEWLGDLRGFAEKNKEILFIIRFHPKDVKIYNNKYSENYYILKNSINDFNTDNLIVDDQKKNMSIYDYVDVVDMMLTYGSTTFVDFSLLGVPIIDADLNKLQYPHYSSFNYSDKNEYFKKIQDVLKNGRDLKISEQYFRWFIWTNIHDTINLSSQIQKTETNNLYNFLYKIISRSFEKIGINLIKNYELKKLNNIHLENKRIIQSIFDNKLNSSIDANLINFEFLIDDDIKNENLKNIRDSLINFGSEYINKDSKFYNFIK